MRSQEISRRTFLALGAGSLAAAAVACAPGKNTVAPSAPPANTVIPSTEPITLTLWDQESGKVSHAWDDLIKGFEAKYPNVTIKRVERSFGDLKSLLKLALSGPKAPDIVEANQGWPDMGSMVKANLLLPLDNYAKAYGWDKRVPANINAANSWTPDGLRFGTGSLYGFTNEGELVGVFYNKTILSKLGLTLPTTFAGFENSLATAKAANVIPIQYTDLDGWPGAHIWASVQERFVPESYMTDLIFGTQYNKVSFDTPQNIKAATTFQSWMQKGYFTPNSLAIGYDDSVNHFLNGSGLYMVTGNWITANLGAESTEFGFMAMPPDTPGGPLVSTGGPGFPLSISASSKNPDAAAAFIDWMTNDQAAQALVQTGEIALNQGFTPTGVQPGTLLSELLAVAARVRDTNAIVPYEDWSTPSFYNTLTAEIQNLMGGKDTPQQFCQKCESDYLAFQKSRPSPASATAQPTSTRS